MTKLFLIEGGEGVGKTTQCLRIAHWLRSIGISVQVISELRSIPENQGIASLILDQASEFDPLTELLLIEAVRAQAYKNIKAFLAGGSVVISDRGPISTIVYQSILGGVPISIVNTLNEIVTQSTQPALIAIIDCPVEITFKRREVRNGIPDKFESKPQEFHQKIRSSFLSVGAQCGAVIVDGAEDQDIVEKRLRELIADKLRLDTL